MHDVNLFIMDSPDAFNFEQRHTRWNNQPFPDGMLQAADWPWSSERSNDPLNLFLLSQVIGDSPWLI